MDSELEAFEFSKNKFLKMEIGGLINLSHEYPEWKIFKNEIEVMGEKSLPINLLYFFDTPQPSDVKHDEFSLPENILNINKNNFLHEMDLIKR